MCNAPGPVIDLEYENVVAKGKSCTKSFYPTAGKRKTKLLHLSISAYSLSHWHANLPLTAINHSLFQS